MQSAPPYSPAHGCDSSIDGWCSAHCPALPDGGRLVARQSAQSPTFACYSHTALQRLDEVSWNMSSNAPHLCGKESAAYLNKVKMTRETLDLLVDLQSCLGKSSTADNNNNHRAQQVAALKRPLLRTATEVVDADDAAASSSRWLQLPSAPPDDDARCIASGRGTRRMQPATAPPSQHREPYLLPNDYLRSANVSKWWWGVCDDDLRHGSIRPPRASVLPSWEPSGDGCDALKGANQAAIAQNTRWRSAGSMQTRRFSLWAIQCRPILCRVVMALGVWRSEGQMVSVPKCAKDRSYLSSLSGIHEFNLDMTVCRPPNSGLSVRARFIRNELLWLNGFTDPNGGAIPSRSFTMCEWAEAARSADLLCLNRGIHFAKEEIVVEQLGHTFDELRGGRRHQHRAPSTSTPHSIVYRGTHAPIPSCHLLDDPLPAPFPYIARDPLTDAYHWADFEPQNMFARRLAKERNITYLDVHYQTQCGRVATCRRGRPHPAIVRIFACRAD